MNNKTENLLIKLERTNKINSDGVKEGEQKLVTVSGFKKPDGNLTAEEPLKTLNL